MPRLERDGAELYYEDRGEGEVVLLTHGWGSSSAAFADVAESLADRFRVLTWDLCGHGASSAPTAEARYAPEAAVADIGALLDQVGAERAIVGGHSLGGFLSMLFRLNAPARVRALFLLGTGPGFRKDEARERWNGFVRGRAEAVEAEGWSALGESAETKIARHHSLDGLIRAARNTLVHRDAAVMDDLPNVDVPTLVLVGAKDRRYLAGSDYMAQKIPGARHVLIPDAGHAAQLHNPAAFQKALGDFLDDLPTSSGTGHARA